jgi:hypothetical protein
MLMNLINTVPRVDPKDLENMINTSMNVRLPMHCSSLFSTELRFFFQDLLMIQYLSQAVKAQLVLNEKLTST